MNLFYMKKNALILLLIFSTSPIINAQSRLFHISPNKLCGIKECKTQPIFKECVHNDCGSIQTSESCGEHWTSWHSAGSGHGNPCPSGCSRVGGAKGISYRSVGFPPKPQEKNKYDCIRYNQVVNKCRTAACSVEKLVRIGGIASYQQCSHPSNGFKLGLYESDKVLKKELGNILDTSFLISNLFKINNMKIESNDDFNMAIRVSIKYLDYVSLFPAQNDATVLKLKTIIAASGIELSTSSIKAIISDEAFEHFYTNIKSSIESCEAE